jgi:hypothetical protein
MVVARQHRQRHSVGHIKAQTWELELVELESAKTGSVAATDPTDATYPTHQIGFSVSSVVQ